MGLNSYSLFALHKSHKWKFDAAALVSYFFALCTFSLYFRPGLMFGHILFFIVPGLYLVLRHWRRNYHAFLFSIAAGVATGFPLQVVAELNNIWNYDFPLFNFLSFAGMRMIPLAWYVLWVGLTISAYSVFFDAHIHRIPKHHRFWKSHYRFLLVCAAITCGSVYLFLYYPSAFIISHPYVVFGSLIFVVPTALILLFHPQLLRDTIKAAAFLSFFMLVYEIVGLKIGWWVYPGEYMALIPFFGTRLPIEELILWVLFGALFCVVAYEEVEHDKAFA